MNHRVSSLTAAGSAKAGRAQPGSAEACSGERGSASIWLLGLAALVLSVTLVVLIQATALLGRHRLERSSDVAALAAARQIGTGGQPCQAAARIARANAAVLEGCVARLDPDDRSGTVAVWLRGRVNLVLLGSRWVHARSRAGRLAPTSSETVPAVPQHVLLFRKVRAVVSAGRGPPCSVPLAGDAVLVGITSGALRAVDG